MASSLAIGLVTSVINTRSLGPQPYGDLKFIGTLFLFLSTISTLGLFNTGSQVLAELMNEGDEKDVNWLALSLLSQASSPGRSC